MRLYHSTTREAADRILAGGFRDATDYYMTTSLHTGVWLSDRPLDENEGAASEALFAVELDDAVLDEYEWVQEGAGYREFLVPAALVNSVPATEVDRDRAEAEKRRQASSGRCAS